MLYIFEKHARSARDYDARLFCIELALYDLVALFKVVRIDDGHAIYADGAAERLEINFSRGVALYIAACRRVMLVTCHACY